MEILTDMNHWHWLVFGVLLIVVELFAWSTFFLWMGISAIVVGLLLYLMPAITWEVQFLIFAVLSIAAIYLGRRLFKVTDIDNRLNSRASIHIGNTYKVVEADDESGKIRINDSLWLAKGFDMKVGQKVKVIDTDSTTLIVEPVED